MQNLISLVITMHQDVNMKNIYIFYVSVTRDLGVKIIQKKNTNQIIRNYDCVGVVGVLNTRNDLMLSHIYL